MKYTVNIFIKLERKKAVKVLRGMHWGLLVTTIQFFIIYLKQGQYQRTTILSVHENDNKKSGLPKRSVSEERIRENSTVLQNYLYRLFSHLPTILVKIWKATLYIGLVSSPSLVVKV